MEIRQCQVPGVLWIVPKDNPKDDTDGPKKELFIHVIPLNITYRILLVIDIPIGDVLDTMDDYLRQFKPEEEQDNAKYNLYWKKSEIKKEVSTKEFPAGATFLMTDGDPMLPTFHSGKLWQCETCPVSFDLFKDLNVHTFKTRLHEMSLFGTSITWGVVQQAEDTKTKKPPTNDRRKLMEEAIIESQSYLNKFAPDDEDLKWEKEVARKDIVEKSRKYKTNQDAMDPEFIEAINEGKDVPHDCYRQMPGTYEAYKSQLHKIITFYQFVKKRPLHYRDFFAFGNEDLVHLSEPSRFFKTWQGATPEMLKKCLAAHNQLLYLVREKALSAEGLDAFGKPHKEDAARMGIIDQENFLKNLDRIEQQIKAKGLWTTLAHRANAKRRHVQQLKYKLEGSDKRRDDAKLKVAVDKFLASDFAIQAEKDLLNAASEYVKLSDKSWNNLSEFAITRLQIFSGGRAEAGDLTVEEWDNKVDDENGTTTIERGFTKNEGTCDAFLHLDEVETFLFKAYEMAKHNQFPELEKEERRSLQSFFVNSAGKSYWHAKKGNPNHLSSWNDITDRLDTVTDFRRIMANWSLSADLVTRANSAFVCSHSVQIMTKVYARQKTKQKEGIKVLERYRVEGLGRRATSSEGRKKFLELKLPPELEERQRKLRINSYNLAFKKAIKVEREHHMEQHRDKPDNPADDASRCSLLEIIVEELKSGEPVSPKEGFLADMFLKRKEGMKMGYVTNEKAIEVIMSVIDSPRFAEHPSAMMLKEILILAAARKIANKVEVIEESVVKKWVKQFGYFRRKTAKLQSFRTKAAYLSLANIAGNENTYSGNKNIAYQVREMRDIQKRLMNDYQTNEEIREREDTQKKEKKAQKKEQQTDILLDSPSTPNRKSPRIAQKTPQTETPDRKQTNLVGKKVDNQSGGNKKANWSQYQRKKLLSHILKNMQNPTVSQKGGRGKADIRENVLPKVSPDIEETPGQSRTLDDIHDQWYRYFYKLDYVLVYNLHSPRFGHPSNNKKGMFGWLNEILPEHQLTIEYLKENRKLLVKRYVDQYKRY